MSEKCEEVIGRIAAEAYESCPIRFRVMRRTKAGEVDLAARELLGWLRADKTCRIQLARVASHPGSQLSAAREVQKCMLRLWRHSRSSCDKATNRELVGVAA